MRRSCSFLVIAALAVTFVSMPFASFADSSGPGAVFDFYFEDNASPAAFETLTGCSVEWNSDGFIRITSDEDIMEKDNGIGDVSFYLREASFAGLDCDEYPYFAINLRNPSSATQFEAHFGTDENTLSPSTVFHTDIESGMDGFKTFITYIPASNVTWVNVLNAPGGLSEQETGSATAEELGEDDYTFTGTLSKFRIDGLYFGGRSGLDPGGTTLDIAWIAFFKTEEDAANYQGPDRSSHGGDSPDDPSVIDSTPFGSLIFDTDDYDDFWILPNGVDDVFFDEEESCYEIVFTESNDPFIAMDFGTYAEADVIEAIDLDEYKIMQIKLKTDFAGASFGNVYFTTDDAPGSYTEDQNVTFQYEATTDWQIINVDCSRHRAWTGELAATRFDAFPKLSAEASVKIAYVAFFKTLSSAKAFAAGGSKFPEPTPSPEPTAAPEITATPEATDPPEATVAPEATAAPEKTAGPSPSKKGCGSVFGTFSLTVVLAAAALFLKKRRSDLLTSFL